MKPLLILLLIIFITSCSTVERREYFSPSSKYAIGPKKPDCGFTNFGGLPDAYSIDNKNTKLKITANQNFHPYTWGPWFVAVIPIFPITWGVEAFVDDNLELNVYIKNIRLKTPNDLEIYINIDGKKHTPLNVIEINERSNSLFQTLSFSVQYDEIEEFTLIIKSNIKEIENRSILFIKTARWSWSQWTPNC